MEGELEKCISSSDQFLTTKTAKGLVLMALETIRDIKALKGRGSDENKNTSSPDESTDTTLDDIPKIPTTSKTSLWPHTCDDN